MQRQIFKKYLQNLLCSEIMNKAYGKRLINDGGDSQGVSREEEKGRSSHLTATSLLHDQKCVSCSYSRQISSWVSLNRDVQPSYCDTGHQQQLQDTTIIYYSNESGKYSVSEI